MGSASIPLILPRVRDPELQFRKYANWLTALLERRRRVSRPTALPFELTIDPATVCQLSCPYCSTGAGTMQRTRGVLGAETHRRFLDEIGDTAFVVWYFSTGEPLLNKRLAEIVSSTRGKEIYSAISTNLSLPLSDDRIDDLLESGLGCISVSCDGATPETYARYRVGGDFDLVHANLRRLLQRREALGRSRTLIEWRFLVFQHNQHEIDRAREMASEIGVDLLEFFPGYAPPDPHPDEVRAADRLDIGPAISGPAVEEAARRPPTTLERHLRTFGPAPGTEIQPGERGQKCDWLYFGSTVFPNGSVGPCCLSNEEIDDFGRLGTEVSFSDIWTNETYSTARELFVSGRWHEATIVCARCPNRDAQDYQFRTTTQALLRNAPDWVLRILSASHDRFFFELDDRLCPDELAPIRDGALDLPSEFPEIRRKLAERDDPVSRVLLDALSAPLRRTDGLDSMSSAR